MPLNKTNLTENLISSEQLAISPAEEEFTDVGYGDKQATRGQAQSVPDRYLPPEMVQEFFFDCIESLLKQKRSDSAKRTDSAPNRYRRPYSHDRAHQNLMRSTNAVTEVLGKQRAFEKTSDKDKQ